MVVLGCAMKRALYQALAHVEQHNQTPVLDNIEFLTQAVEHAVTTYRSRLATTGKWELVEAPDPKGLEETMKTIGSTPEAKEVLTEMADKNQLPGDVSEAMMARLIMASFRAGKQATSKASRRK